MTPKHLMSYMNALKYACDGEDKALCYCGCGFILIPLQMAYAVVFGLIQAAIAAFFGMISNIDDNVGDTRKLLKELGVYENTIFIFTTDNGTAGGDRAFGATARPRRQIFAVSL